MLGRFKRRLSRTKSASASSAYETVDVQHKLERKLTLSPSDENLISQLHFQEGQETLSTSQRALDDGKAARVGSTVHRDVVNSVEHGILSLPTEVLLGLQRHLQPSSEVALRHTCARFLGLYSTPSFYLTGENKFEFLCMHERDQDDLSIKLKRLVCGYCQDLHPRTAFAPAERKLPPAKRDCRQVWLCAHKHIGYQQAVKDIKPGHEAPFKAQALESCSRCREVVRNRSVADRLEKGTSAADLDSENTATLLVTKIALLQRPLPDYKEKIGSGDSSFRQVFSTTDVANALSAIDFPICSHVRLSDPFLLSRFCRACINTVRLPKDVKGPPCISSNTRYVDDPKYLGKCRQTCFTRGCRTRFMYQARESLTPDASGRRQVWLILAIYRWLGPLKTTSRDRLWISHTVPHATRIEMRKKWEELEKSRRSSKPMADWSICLLHPEDCNVRDSAFVPHKAGDQGAVEDALKGLITNWKK